MVSSTGQKCGFRTLWCMLILAVYLQDLDGADGFF